MAVETDIVAVDRATDGVAMGASKDCWRS